MTCLNHLSFYDVFESIILHINNASLVFLRKIMSNVVTAKVINNCRSLYQTENYLQKKQAVFFLTTGNSLVYPKVRFWRFEAVKIDKQMIIMIVTIYI